MNDIMMQFRGSAAAVNGGASLGTIA